MTKHFTAALLALLFFLPARAQVQFSDSLQVSLLTCSSGPDAYERFGHSGIRILDLKQPALDITFHYGVFSFNAPHFVYRFVKGETDYQMGAVYTSNFVTEYQRRGLGMIQQVLSLDSLEKQTLVTRLWQNYEPQNRTYRYGYCTDNCATRPYHQFNASTDNAICYDSTWINALTLRQMIQQKTGTDNWLDFGIALSVAGSADKPSSYERQLFLPDNLLGAVNHAQIPRQIGGHEWMTPLCVRQDTLLVMRPDVAEAIAAPDALRPATLCAIFLLLGMILSMLQYRPDVIKAGTRGRRVLRVLGNGYDTLLFAVTGLTGVVIWFLNFCSEHPEVDRNINCLWLLPTNVIFAVLLWLKGAKKVSRIYCGIVFAGIIAYVILDWITGQYCPSAFLLLIATLLLRGFMRIYNITDVETR